MKKRAFLIMLVVILTAAPAFAIDTASFYSELSIACEIFSAPAPGKSTAIEDGFRCPITNKGVLVCKDTDEMMIVWLEVPCTDGEAFFRAAAAILYVAPYAGKGEMFSALVFQFMLAGDPDHDATYSIASDGTAIKIEKQNGIYRFTYAHPYGSY